MMPPFLVPSFWIYALVVNARSSLALRHTRAAAVDAVSGHSAQPFASVVFGTACGIFGSLVDSILVRMTFENHRVEF